MKPDQPLITPSLPSQTSGPLGLQRNTPTTGSGLPPRFSKKQLALALGIAAISDALGAFVTLAPPVVWAVDVVTAGLLFAVLGWQWLLLPGLVLEAIPAVGVLPLWLLVVGGIVVWGTPRPKLKWLRKGDA